jgi:nitronate monooxygenase
LCGHGRRGEARARRGGVERGWVWGDRGRGLDGNEIAKRVARTRELTERAFGVNLIIADLEDPEISAEDREFLAAERAAVAEARVAGLVLWGPPDTYVDPAHEAGVKVLAQIGSVEEAEAAVDASVDAVIAQGFEAGGHVRGTAEEVAVEEVACPLSTTSRL